MHGEPRPSYARRIVLVVLAVCVGLVVLGALLPSPQQREVSAKGRKLVGLTKVATPAVSSRPAFVVPWKNASVASNVPGRSITVHVYLKVGVRTSRYDLLDQRYSGIPEVRSRTVFHIAFDPRRSDELELVTAIAAPKAGGSLQLLRDGFLAKRPTARLATFVRAVKLQVGEKRWADARGRVLAELTDGSATAYPAGTVLYEAGGRCYREPRFVGAGIGAPYATSSTSASATAYEALEAMSDRRVELP